MLNFPPPHCSPCALAAPQKRQGKGGCRAPGANSSLQGLTLREGRKLKNGRKQEERSKELKRRPRGRISDQRNIVPSDLCPSPC